jgi:hypothetical protein
MDEATVVRTGCEGPRTDADVCRSAAMRLRQHPMRRLTLHELRLASATSQLLDALGCAMDGDVTAIPVRVRQAALRLAHECRAHEASSDVRADLDYDARGAAGPGAARATRSRAPIPHCASLQLGRMG